MKREQKGITLIALVITIIVLLILAGIVLSLTLGKSGIILHAEEAESISEEKRAQEKLSLVLLDMQADKVTNPNYNENEYLTEKIVEQGMIVMGDIVYVDGWQFQIDRSIPNIRISLGKGQENQEIILTAKENYAKDYTKATIVIEIEYEGEIARIQINGEEEIIPVKQEGKYVLSKDILENGSYTIYVKDENGGYTIQTIDIKEITEDMEIWTKADMEQFRDNVNMGRTYEGRRVTVMADIDLNPGKYTIAEDGSITFASDAEQWIPIANYGKNTQLAFAGTFDGKNHTIKGLYIHAQADHQGIFGYNTGKIQHVILKDSSVYTTIGGSGGIVGRNSGDIEFCANYAKITGNSRAGGIVDYNFGNVRHCFNAGKIRSTDNKGKQTYTGGILGSVGLKGGSRKLEILNCYNVGEIIGGAVADNFVGGIIGVVPWAVTDKISITNCYNIGKVSGNYSGGIMGNATKYVSFTNCYWNNSQNYVGLTFSGYGSPTTSRVARVAGEGLKAYATTLGEAYANDEDGINGGYPILIWQKKFSF